jgi:hypothetical protein
MTKALTYVVFNMFTLVSLSIKNCGTRCDVGVSSSRTEVQLRATRTQAEREVKIEDDSLLGSAV